jgi:hypothetical protein
MQQRTRLTMYKESTAATTHKIERLRLENAILHSGACPPLEHDCELQEVYRHLSDVEHGWNYTLMLLDITREEVETRTHGIVHLEHHMEAQDTELEERAEMMDPDHGSSLSTTRRPLPCRASRRTRSRHC